MPSTSHSQQQPCWSRGQIELDRFKTPDWPWMVAEASAYRPVAVHFSLQAGRGIARLTGWDAVDEMVKSIS